MAKKKYITPKITQKKIVLSRFLTRPRVFDSVDEFVFQTPIPKPCVLAGSTGSPCNSGSYI
jgi:hypothetical protein